MAGEITVPLLPCSDIDEIEEFYVMLGFTRTYRQLLPNPHVALRREDINLHFFGMPGFKAEDSYGTCLVIVRDIGALYEAFAAGMRATHGKLLISGIPRMTRPRKRKNADNVSGFAVIDPGGNWIRIHAAKADDAATPDAPAKADADEPGETARASSRLANVLQNAVVMGDSKGFDRRAAEILDGGLRRDAEGAPAVDLLEALAYRAELAVRTGDTQGAADFLRRARAIELSDDERRTLRDTLVSLEDLATSMGSA